MRSEIARIGGNYLRLVIGFGVGLLIVRQLLLYGSDIFNIFTIVTVGAGVGIMLRELLRIALTSHLSRAWSRREEEGGEREFRSVFGQSMTLCALAALAGAALMALVALAIPYLAVEPQNIAAAQTFVAARTAIMICTVAISPLLTMLLVMQKFGRMNLLMTAERVADFLAVLTPLIALAPGIGGADALVVFAVASAALICSLYLFAGWWITRSAPSLLKPTWRWQSSSARKPILLSIGWAFALVLSFNLYLRFDTFFINTHFGVAATIAFGLSVQLIGMVRQASSGIVLGLDAVAAKARFGTRRTDSKSHDADSSEHYGPILVFSSYLQALVSGSIIVALLFTIDRLFDLWVGSRIDDPTILPLARSMSLIMLVGIVAVTLSDAWTNTLNGIGRKSIYVRYTIIVAISNVVILVTLGAFGAITPIGLTIIYSLLLAVAHLVIVPVQYSRETGTKLSTMLAPILRGLIAPSIAAALIYAFIAPSSSNLGLTDVMACLVVIGTAALLDIAIFLCRSTPGKA